MPNAMPHLPAAALRAFLTGMLLVAVGCASAPLRPYAAPARGWSDAEQLVVVTTPGWDAIDGQLRRFERTPAGWREVGAGTPIVIGRSGSGWGLGLHPTQATGPQKREGDGRAPAGVFAIGPAFGYAPSADTALPYQAMDAGDYCIDVPDSPLYNRIVDTKDVGAEAVKGSTEPMRRDIHLDGDDVYRLGFVIEHNAGGRANAGSCIFAHLWRGPSRPTAGCTAMPEPAMRELLAWLGPSRKPVFVLLPEPEYRRVQAEWGLPPLP
jgi:L,D-peptidoglycan transpeptidase YkuD (ErfK/YbiS/YcfS/YnhG family)